MAAKLFETIAPRFSSRPGGYTRLVRLGFRRGDSAELAQVELVGSEYDPDLEKPRPDRMPAEKPERQQDEGSGVGGRLRRVASRLRGGRNRR